MNSAYLDQFLVPTDKEQDYCQTHGIIFRRNQNGVRLVTVNRSIKDSVFTGITYQFNAGSWFDPAGKKGAHHFLEHFFNQPIRQKAADFDCEVNAFTSSLRLAEYLAGPANLRSKDFGVWQLLREVGEVIKDPFKKHKDLHKFFNSEKNVVLAEHSSNLASHDWHVGNTMFSWLFDKQNPVTDYPLGSPETLKSITLEDLYKVMEESLVPKNCVVTTVTDSDFTTGLELTDRIEESLRDFPRVTNPRNALPIDDMKRINHSIKPGEVYHFDHGINNGQITLLLGWQCSFPQFSSKDFSFDRITEVFGAKAFDFVRDKGWSYDSHFNVVYPNNDIAAFYIMVDLPQTSDLTDVKIKSITGEIVNSFTLSSREVEQLVQKERLRQLTWPVSVESRMNWILAGLLNYDRLIDIDKVIESHLRVNKSDYEYWINFMTTTEPFIGVVGSGT